MDKEFEDEVMNKYRFFPKENVRSNENLSCLAWGFECGKGWRKLLSEFFEELDKLDLPQNFTVDQVKEKFGTLRIYTSCHTEEIYNLIKKYEKMSGKTCEKCGHENAKLRTDGWWVTYCDKCYEVRKKNVQKVLQRQFITHSQSGLVCRLLLVQ